MQSFKNKKPNICVVGDLMIDHYLWGSCERISPEAPVQVVDIAKESMLLGGAGNVINNLITFGANVSVCSVVGEDENANVLVSMLEDIGVNTKNIVEQNGRKTTKKSKWSINYKRISNSSGSFRTF